MGRRITKARQTTGASIARASAAVRAFPVGRSVRDPKSWVTPANSTIEDAVKDIRIPRHVSATQVNNLLAQRARQISNTIRQEEQAIAKILEDTGKRITKVHGNSSK